MSTEVTYKWHELSEEQVAGVIAAHQQAWKSFGVKVTFSHMLRLFWLGCPTIVWGEQPDKEPKQYCRIAAESVDVMKVITREYINEK